MQPTTTTKNNNKLRIVFMGTPEFAAFILKQLIHHNYTVVAVVTVADKPAGRGKKLKQSAVKELAVAKNIAVLQPTNLKDEAFITQLSSFNAEVFVVVAFRMLPQVVWSMPASGCFNLHASLLPQYRGAAPINWAIINGEQKTGVTTFFLDEKIDTGAIIKQHEIAIEINETAGSLHDKLMHIGADLVCDTLDHIENQTIEPIPQKTETIKEAPKLFKENCKIDWEQSAEQVYNKIRGLSPYPTAWCLVKDQEELITIKLYEAVIDRQEHHLKAGTIIRSKKELKVATADYFIKLKTIQLPAKKKMNVEALLNGLNWTAEAHML